MDVSVKVGWDHVLVNLGGCLTKINFPIESKLTVSIPPTILKESGVEITDFQVTLVSAAEEYSRLLKTNGTLDDFNSFCGPLAKQFLTCLRGNFLQYCGKKLPQLKHRPSVIWSSESSEVAKAMLVLENV